MIRVLQLALTINATAVPVSIFAPGSGNRKRRRSASSPKQPANLCTLLRALLRGSSRFGASKPPRPRRHYAALMPPISNFINYFSARASRPWRLPLGEFQYNSGFLDSLPGWCSLNGCGYRDTMLEENDTVQTSQE